MSTIVDYAIINQIGLCKVNQNDCLELAKNKLTGIMYVILFLEYSLLIATRYSIQAKCLFQST